MKKININLKKGRMKLIMAKQKLKNLPKHMLKRKTNRKSENKKNKISMRVKKIMNVILF
jgi:hypothetical protein